MLGIPYFWFWIVEVVIFAGVAIFYCCQMIMCRGGFGLASLEHSFYSRCWVWRISDFGRRMIPEGLAFTASRW
jgi:hypothetical protein